MKIPLKRKICTSYDGVCLQGGCGYCNDFGEWRFITILIREVKQRSELKLSQDLQWGLDHDFANAQVKYDDGSLKLAISN